MFSTMMQVPLSVNALLERGKQLFGNREIVSRLPDGSFHRTDYAGLHRRARQLAAALVRAGVEPGEPVATLMWNHAWHLEAYFGIPAAGAVLHTLNLRLSPDDIAYIIEDAGDRIANRRRRAAAADRAVEDARRPGAGDRRAHFRSAGARTVRKLRGVHRRRRDRLSLPGARRERRLRHVLFVRHDRPAEGRRAFPSLDGAACTVHLDPGLPRSVLPTIRSSQ